ncbi:MAG: hypothetical protein KAW14_10645 [Candidatus Aegiribacteria sp.]|nr:hypothetical protein [Candidatus Aegiribacteria sp.]
MSNKKYFVPVALSLLLAVAGGLLFRSWFSDTIMPPPSRMQGETTQSYRYAMMISEGRAIPSNDMLVMHPEGMSTSENSIFEEYLAGGLHRITGGDFNSFLRLFCLLFPLLTIPALYFWMRAGLFTIPYALAGSSLYAFLLPALLRTRGESFYRETVALPLIIILGWLTERALSRKNGDSGKAYAAYIAPGVILFLALAAWKVTAFISFFLLLYILWKECSTDQVPRKLKISLALAQISAAILLTHMRHDAAWISPATVMALFLIVPSSGKKWLFWTASALALISAMLGSGSTGHVGAVIMAKLRFAFAHPSDPSLLSPDARLFWVSGYTTPTPAQFLFLFGIPLIAAIPGIPSFFRTKRNTLLFWFLPFSLAGYLFFDRLHILLAVALIPVIAESLKKTWATVPVIALIVAQSIFPASIAEALSSTGLEFRNSASLLSDTEVDDMIFWIDRKSEPDEAFLSFWHISGLISAYAEHPVVTHTFFESEKNRDTIIRFAELIFQPEDSLLSFMKEKECDLVVYQADFLFDRSYSGLCYLAGLTDIPPDAVALKMHYNPSSLDSFSLVFQGPSLRIFRVGGIEDISHREFLFERRYSHCYDNYDDARALLADPRSASGYLADTGLEKNDPNMLSAALFLGVSGGGPQDVTQMMLNDLIQMYIQDNYNLDYLAEDIETFMYWCGSISELRLLLARFYASSARYSDAIREYDLLLEEDPGNTEAEEEMKMLLNEIRS